MELVFWSSVSLIPISFLTHFAVQSKSDLKVKSWVALSLWGLWGMGTCMSAESILQSYIDPMSFVWMAILVPIIEETIRLIFLKVAGANSIAAGTWFGGIMGIVETCLKTWFRGAHIENPAFRVIASVPIHSLIGGIHSRGFIFLPVAIIVHGSFNAGVSGNSVLGLVWALLNVWIAGGLWLRELYSEQENK